MGLDGLPSPPMTTLLHLIGWYRKDQELLHKLEGEQGAFPAAVQEALSYLKTHSSPQLEKALREKLVNDQLTPIVSHLLETAPDLLDTCCKVATIDTQGIADWAKDAALYLPEPKATPLAPKRFSRLPSLPLGMVGKVAYFLLSTFALAHSINFDRLPKTQWSAQSQWMFLRELASDLFWIKDTLLEYFGSTKKAVAAASALFAFGIAGKLVLSKFNIARGIIPTCQHFRDLTKEVLPDVLIGRGDELAKMHRGVSPAPGEKSRISILIGPPGSGKTEMVTSYAQKIRKGEIPQQNGVQLLAVNTEYLTGWGKWDHEDDEYSSPLDRLFKEIEGKEDRVILFFDEFQNAAAAEGLFNKLRGAMLEELKTKLLERNVRCILATTEDEYNEHIAPHKAFVDRTTPIHMSSLSNDLTQQVLRQQENGNIEVTEEAIVALATANTLGANPRKALNLRTDAVNYVYNWTPVTTRNQLSWYSSEIQKVRRDLQHIENEGGRNDATGLQALLEKQKELETKAQAQAKLHTQFLNLKKLQLSLREQRNSLAHRIAKNPAPSEAELKTVAWIRLCVLPELGKLIETTKQAFKKDFGEDIPEQVTPEIIKQLVAK